MAVSRKERHTADMHAVYCAPFLFGTTGNGLVIHVTGFKMRKTVNTIWYLSSAVADFLFSAFLPTRIVKLSRGADWPFRDFMCKFNSLVVHINMFTSIFLLAAISIDRGVSTWMVVRAKSNRTPCKVEIACAVICLGALGCGLPYTVFRVTKTEGSRTVLSTLNSCMNPLLYVFMCKDFKQKLHQSVLLVLEGELQPKTQMPLNSQALEWRKVIPPPPSN
ncbi:hypothetical protein JZ751_018506 [Albula glossodonta]|uniref:G-protein coupled receptors family 1 profile domain-containing protein n=1 Tax=Albula glossodonta TaxID=121402 RepID=A0A8T2NNY9_9TELE|nr:hypothetical protein JZ751_018506 [Albula glossodonta]